jgi:hypothetical protein
MVFITDGLTLGPPSLGEYFTLKIVCQVCGVEGYLQHIGKNYYRVRHYVEFRKGKPYFQYHKQDSKYVHSQRENNQVDPIDPSGQLLGDHNLLVTWRNKGESRAGSLVRIGLRPPKPVVVGSNPTPPAIRVFGVSSETLFGLFS